MANLNRGVRRRETGIPDRDAVRRLRIRLVTQVKNIRLKVGQQAMFIDRHEAVLDVRFGGADRDEKFFSQTAQGCQQRMSLFHVQRIRVDCSLGDLAAQSVHSAPAQDIGPVFSAGIQEEEIDRADSCEPGKDLKVKRRQVRNAEDRNAGGQTDGCDRKRVEPQQEISEKAGPVNPVLAA